MTRLLTRPLRLYTVHGTEAHRKVSWLELFFDLVFVAAVAQVAEPLRHHYDLEGLVRLTILFALIWWAWSGYTFFASRFDADDGVQRGLTLLQMFVVAAMAANAGEALDSRSTAGFAAAYAVLRVILVGQYLRARHLPDARPLTTRFIAGHGAAAVLWLLSAAIPAPARYGLWAAALVIDLGTPLAALPHAEKAPTHSAHLPERFGLFTIILLGEAVVAVMHGMKSHEDWSVPAASSAFLGMALVFLVWWWYFHRASAAGERTMRTRREAVRGHVWGYAHFPLYLGIVVLGVGVERAIEAAAHTSLASMDVILMSGAATAIGVAMAALASTGPGARPAWGHVGRSVALAVPVTAALTGVGVGSPVAVVATLAGLCAVMAMAVPAREEVRRPAHARAAPHEAV